ncbi:hypothetical protein POM88_051344 [Heracleum sosnowskyi]|uniref:Uncharacterized protein n=1 Tax=Heracleum sosnowskyi TaxID=360622 RepID=A0AAD8H0F7_9APIA|nr:hypothetical protein POM88_051344 [Heracleum sosnowskyi]
MTLASVLSDSLAFHSPFCEMVKNHYWLWISLIQTILLSCLSVIRTCTVRPNVRRATSLVDIQDDVFRWCRSPLDSSTRRLCSTQGEDKHITYSTGKTLAQTKKEQSWCYDPTIKYEPLRQCAVPRYAYCDDSATDSSESSDSESENETMTLEEAQARKDKILAEARKEQPFPNNPLVNYELLKKFAYVDSPDSFASPPSDSETDTPAQVEARKKQFLNAKIQGQIVQLVPFHIKVDSRGLPAASSDSSASESEVETQEVAQIQKDKFVAGTKDEQLFCYNPNIRYEPLKKYIVPRFAFFDSSSTDWSTSSDSECEAETMGEKEAQSYEDKIPAGSKEEKLIGGGLG